MLDFENKHHPFPERAASILFWRHLAEVRVSETEQVLEQGRALSRLGIKPFDALHVACAIAARADLFVTTDDALLRKLLTFQKVVVLSPGEALAKAEGWYED